LRRPFPKGKTANGANIAATMLLLSSEILSAAILFRYGSDALSKRLPDHAKKHIFMFLLDYAIQYFRWMRQGGFWFI